MTGLFERCTRHRATYSRACSLLRFAERRFLIIRALLLMLAGVDGSKRSYCALRIASSFSRLAWDCSGLLILDIFRNPQKNFGGERLGSCRARKSSEIIGSLIGRECGPVAANLNVVLGKCMQKQQSLLRFSSIRSSLLGIRGILRGTFSVAAQGLSLSYVVVLVSFA
jgi:hypothetical protein